LSKKKIEKLSETKKVVDKKQIKKKTQIIVEKLLDQVVDKTEVKKKKVLSDYEWVKRKIVSASRDLSEAQKSYSNGIKATNLRMAKTCDKSDKVLFKLTQQMEEFNSKLESFEESMLFIMHSIKKNQFLYSHYPDEWVKDYLSLKHGLVTENEYMDRLRKERWG